MGEGDHPPPGEAGAVSNEEGAVSNPIRARTFGGTPQLWPGHRVKARFDPDHHTRERLLARRQVRASPGARPRVQAGDSSLATHQPPECDRAQSPGTFPSLQGGNFPAFGYEPSVTANVSHLG
jgi:hypothetical protein